MMNTMSDIWCLYTCITYTVYKWRTPFENGAQKFGQCAIGAQPLNPRIIPALMTRINKQCCIKSIVFI